MKFKNISGQMISVKRVDGTIQVQPDEEFFTAPAFVASLIETGAVEKAVEKVEPVTVCEPSIVAEPEDTAIAELPKRKANKEAE